MQNPPIEQIVAAIERSLAELSGQISQTTDELRGAVPRMREAVDAIEDLGPKTAGELTRILRGQPTMAEVFAGLGREEETGRPATEPETPTLVASIRQLLDSLKQQIGRQSAEAAETPAKASTMKEATQILRAETSEITEAASRRVISAEPSPRQRAESLIGGPTKTAEALKSLQEQATVSKAFASLPRAEETGRIRSQTETATGLLTGLRAMVDALTRQTATQSQQHRASTQARQTVSQEVRGLSLQERQQRLIETKELLPVEEVQRRLVLKERLPTVRQVVVESEKAQQAKRDEVARIAAQQAQEHSLAAASKAVIPVDVSKQREIPIKEQIAGLTWGQRYQRLRESGTLLSPEAVQEREALQKRPTRRQVIVASEAEEERRRQWAAQLPIARRLRGAIPPGNRPTLPGAPPIQAAIPAPPPTAPPVTATGAFGHIRHWFGQYQYTAAKMRELQIPVAKEIEGLSLADRQERLEKTKSLLSEEAARQRLLLPETAKISPAQRIQESEKRQESLRTAELAALRKTPMGRAVGGQVIQGLKGAAKAHPYVAAAVGVATAAVGITFWLAKTGLRLKDFSEQIFESSRHLHRFAPQIANAVVSLDRTRLLLDAQLARQTSGSARALGKALEQMHKDMQPLRETWQTMKNLFGTAAARLAVPAMKGGLAGLSAVALGPVGPLLLSVMPWLMKAAEKYLGTPEQKEMIPYATFLQNIQNGAFREARRPPRPMPAPQRPEA